METRMYERAKRTLTKEIRTWVFDNHDDELIKFYVENKGLAKFDYNRFRGGYDD